MAYAHDLWRIFGVGFLEQDRLTWHEFAAMVATADEWRRQEKEANRGR